MRISDWSSDVCSSDLIGHERGAAFRPLGRGDGENQGAAFQFDIAEHRGAVRHRHTPRHTPGALRYSVRFLAQPVPEVRGFPLKRRDRSEEHTSELQSLMRISYAVFCLKKKNNQTNIDKNT